MSAFTYLLCSFNKVGREREPENVNETRNKQSKRKNTKTISLPIYLNESGLCFVVMEIAKCTKQPVAFVLLFFFFLF